MPRYRLATSRHTTAHKGPWAYDRWRDAYHAAERDCEGLDGAVCVVQTDRLAGPKGETHVITLAAFAYGKRLSRHRA